MEGECPPKPIIYTPQNNIIEKEYKLKSSSKESIEYNLKLGSTEKTLSITLYNIKEINYIIFQKIYYLEDLIKISKIFKICDNLTEAVSYLNENLENKTVVLNEENNEYLELNFKMSLPNKTEEKFKLEIPKINIEQNPNLDILLKYIKDIKEDNNKKEEEISYLKNEIQIMKNNFEKNIKELQIQLDSVLVKKNILNNKLFKTLIEEAIKEKREEIKNKNIEWKLLYKASIDGTSASDCQRKINNKYDTVTIIFSSTGNIFGVYRNIATNGDAPWRIDNSAFIFSLDNYKIYRVKNNYQVIALDNGCFIQFKGTIVLTGDILNTQYSDKTKNEMNQYFEGFTKNYELNRRNPYYYIDEFEVYTLIFN